MRETMSVFNKYLIFERHLYNFTVSYNLEFIKKTKEHKHYIREFKPIVKKRKAQGYFKVYLKKPLKGQIKRSMSKSKINKIMR